MPSGARAHRDGGSCSAAKPPRFGTQGPRTVGGMTELPGPLGWWFSSSFFVVLIRDSENADTRGFGMKRAFHQQLVPLARSSHPATAASPRDQRS